MPQIRTGLKLTDTPAIGVFKSFQATYGPSWSTDDIKAALKQKKRSREKFPAAEWIKNQNPFGSCVSHGFTNAFERQYYDKTGRHTKMQPHFLYALVNGGRDEGATLPDGAKRIQDTGLPALVDSPDSSKIYLNQYNVSSMKPKLVRAKEVYEIRDEQTLLTALAMGFYCTVAIDVNDAFANYNQDSIAPYSTGPGNHCVCVDDAVWDEGAGVFRYNNPGSWGVNMGYGGYWWLTWKRHMAIPIRYTTFYATPEVDEYIGDSKEPPATEG